MRLFNTSKKNRVEELANKLAEGGKTDQLEAKLQDFKISTLSDEERESWYHLWGITAFQRGDRTTALQRFEEAREAFPTSAMIAFSLGQEYEYAAQPARAFELFDRVRFPSIPSSFALAQARYAYLWDELDRAIAYIAPIFDAYDQLRIADDHFLYVRGLPFFSTTWANLGAFLELQGKLEELEDRTEQASRKLHDFDFKPLKLRVRCLRENDFHPLLNELQTRIKESASEGWPSGYLAIEAAAIEAMEIDSSIGRQRLQSVSVTENDFPWLRDMRTLAFAALANASGDSKTEELLLRDFKARQPYLFEPDHAFNFRLLAYQEKLKHEYRNGRKRHV